MKRILQVLLLSLVVASVCTATATLTLNPVNGAVTGAPGQSVGWGFTISDDTFWLVVTGTDFCSSFNTSPHDVFPCTNPVPGGTYTDFTQFNFVVSAPNSPDTSQQNFSYNPPCANPGDCTGTGAFTIDSSTPFGTYSGVIVVDYDLYSGDPSGGGTLIQQDNFITANASVTVAPEPGTWLLMGSALAGLGLARFRKRKS
jgi:PEP-CTERM motif